MHVPRLHGRDLTLKFVKKPFSFSVLPDRERECGSKSHVFLQAEGFAAYLSYAGG